MASKAYNKETSIIDALTNVVTNMHNYIESRHDQNLGKIIKWVSNPVNPEENFADKWVEHPQREKNFYKWLDQVELDIQAIVQKRGLQYIAETMKKPFGDQVVTKTFSTIGERNLIHRESGDLKMTTGKGILSSIGSVVTPKHNYHGNN